MTQSLRLWLMSAVLLSLLLSSPAMAQDDDAQPRNTAPVLLNFRNAPLETVLEYLSETAGLVVIKTLEVQGTVTVISRQPLSVDEAVSVLNSVLKEKGYAAILMDRTLKIVDFTAASKESIPVRTGSDPQRIPRTDEMVTQVIPLRHADCSQLATDLAPLLPSYAVLAANVRTNSLILTDTSANIRRITEIVEALDASLANEWSVRVFPLQYANARDAARLINELFGDDGRSGGTAGGRGGRGQNQDPRAQFFLRMAGGGVQAGTETTTGRPEIRPQASADERTNTIVVTGSPAALQVIAQVIQELDSNPQATQAVFIHKVRNGTATQLANVLTELFRDRNQQATGRAQTGRTDGGGALRNVFGQQTDDASSFTVTATDLVGQVDVVAEPDTNSLIVMTSPRNFEQVQAIIDELDRPVPQVLIKVLVAEVTHSKLHERGVEWSIFNNAQTVNLFTELGLAATPGGMVLRLAENNIEATIQALDETGKLDVLSRPYILVAENQEARITVGQEVPLIRRSRVTDAGQVINDIEYQDVGIILVVKPHINSEGLVVMDIAPEISQVSDSTVQLSETVRAPIISKRSASSRVAIQDGQTIVIGGLMQDTLSERVRKVPLLGDIPLLGELFKSTSQDKEKTELLIFLTPHVARDSSELHDLSSPARSGAQIVPHAVEPGMYDQHMENMQRGREPAPE